MKIGIFGGSFNPPHKGHVNIARRAAELAGLDRVLVIPACTPPHKAANALATEKDRLAMCRLTFTDPVFEVSSIEMQRGGRSYSVDTLTQLKAEYPEDELVMIIGSDMLLSFDRWYRWQDILRLCRLCVFSRENDVPREKLVRYALDVLGLDAGRGDILVFDTAVIELSSTEIRQKLVDGEDVSDLIDERAAEYIADRKVYTPDVDRCDEFAALAGTMLREDRYIHSLNVAQAAQELAGIYSADGKTAYCAGLLHDITKHLDYDKQLKIIEEAGIILSSDEKANKSLWHSVSASAFAENVLNIKNPEIISAVRYHTTGRAGMSLLEKIVYIADYISKDRNYPDVDVMRRLAKISLNDAALYSLKYCIGKLTRDEKIVHTDSVKFYNELILQKAAAEESAGLLS